MNLWPSERGASSLPLRYTTYRPSGARFFCFLKEIGQFRKIGFLENVIEVIEFCRLLILAKILFYQNQFNRETFQIISVLYFKNWSKTRYI